MARRKNKNVENQLAQADELQKQHIESRKTSDDAPPVVEEKTETIVEQAVEETVSEPKVEEQTSALKPTENWEQKYKVINGKYSAEVPMMASEIRELKQKIEQLSAVQHSIPQPIEPKPLKSNITKEEVQEYGENFTDYVKRASKDVVQQYSSNNETASLQNEVKELKENQKRLEQQKFYSDLTQLCPAWEQVNVDPEFEKWLKVRDDLSGFTREQLLVNAQSKNDSITVANIFNAYLSEATIKAPSNSQPNLENQVVPKTTQRTSVPQGKKIFTTTEITKFYQDCKDKKYTQKQADEIEREIFNAQNDNRIRRG